jgi:hypothetical protein
MIGKDSKEHQNILFKAMNYYTKNLMKAKEITLNQKKNNIFYLRMVGHKKK